MVLVLTHPTVSNVDIIGLVYLFNLKSNKIIERIITDIYIFMYSNIIIMIRIQ